jgi:multiple sugar transport system substrate-binding protein
MKKAVLLAFAALMLVGTLAGCAQPTAQIVEKPVTVVVEKEVRVKEEVLATVIVEKEVQVEKEVIQTVIVETEKLVDKPVTVVVEKERIVEKEVVVQEPVTIVFWHPQAADDFRGKLLDSMIQDFMAEYPWITIESIYQGGYSDLYKKIMAAIPAGEAPDLAVSYPSMIEEYMVAQAVTPLDSYIFSSDIGLSAKELTDFYPGYLEECRFQSFGNQYLAWPFTKSAVGMYYNLGLINEAGFDGPPTTWTEFEEQCNAIAEKTDGQGYAYYESASTFDAWLYSRGVRQLNDTATEAIFNGPEAVEALDMLNRLIETGGAWKPEGSYADQAEFGQGNAAFTFSSTSGTYYYGQAIKNGAGEGAFEWGQTNIPQSDPENPATVMYGGSICVFRSTTAKQQAAWLFLKWFTDTDQTAKWGSQSGYMPVRYSAAAKLDDYFASNPIAKQQIEEIVPYGLPEPSVRGEQEIRDFIYDAIVASTTGIMTPQEALDDAVAKANEALARGRE